MTGAGFGGCTVNLVESAHTADFVENVRQSYIRGTGVIPDVYVCQAEDGVRTLDVRGARAADEVDDCPDSSFSVSSGCPSP